MSKLISAVFGDVVGTFGVGGNTAGELLGRLLQKRRETARDILLEELARGGVQSVDLNDESASMVLRYLRSADEGAARRNLRLLAQAIAGAAKGAPITADEFLYLAGTLEGLRREEILYLGSLVRNWNSESIRNLPTDQRHLETMSLVKAELIPSVLTDEADLNAMTAALVRTGFLTTNTAWDYQMYDPSPLLMRVVDMIDFEAAES